MNEQLNRLIHQSVFLDLISPERDRTNEETFVDDGRTYWLALRSEAHGEVPSDRFNRKASKRWMKFAKKMFRSTGSRDLLRAVDFPNCSAGEISAWLIERQAPAWAADAEREFQARAAQAGEKTPNDAHAQFAGVEEPTDEELLDAITSHAYELTSTEQPPEHVVRMLEAVYPAMALKAVDPARRATMDHAARLGYFARFAEGTSVAGAGVPSDEVAAALRTCIESQGTADAEEGLSQCAARFALNEPLAGSIEDMQADGSLLAVVPGLGHEARISVAGRMCGGAVSTEMYEFPEDESAMQAVLVSEEYQAFIESEPFRAGTEHALRCWLYGYFLRAFEEYFLES
jgi:hypothetical protein